MPASSGFGLSSALAVPSVDCCLALFINCAMNSGPNDANTVATRSADPAPTVVVLPAGALVTVAPADGALGMAASLAEFVLDAVPGSTGGPDLSLCAMTCAARSSPKARTYSVPFHLSYVRLVSTLVVPGFSAFHVFSAGMRCCFALLFSVGMFALMLLALSTSILT